MKLKNAKRERTHSSLLLSPKAKATLLDLVGEWDGIRDKLRKSAEQQAQNKDYPPAAENFLLSEGVDYCARNLQKILSP